jgi:hypothetical protein
VGTVVSVRPAVHRSLLKNCGWWGSYGMCNSCGNCGVQLLLGARSCGPHGCRRELLLAPIADGSASEGLLNVELLEGDIRQQMIKLLGCEGRHLLAVIANAGNNSW